MQVETIADAYMVAAGAPEPNEQHAMRMSELALDMRESVVDIIDPSTNDHIKIRLGTYHYFHSTFDDTIVRYKYFVIAISEFKRKYSFPISVRKIMYQVQK